MFKNVLNFRGVIILALTISSAAWANSKRLECDSILELKTLAGLTHAAMAEQRELRKETPLRTFVDATIDQARLESGEEGPQALSDMNPRNTKFQALQAPWAEAPGVVKLDDPKASIPLRLETEFNGQKIKTTAYLSLPKRIQLEKLDGRSKKHFAIGKEYRDTGVIFWMHGGGTPTATGVNAMSVGLELAKRDVPVIALDLPGHGNGPIYPFTSGFEIMRYLVEVMKDNIHPDVPITIMGHSWGGQFAIQFYLNYPRLNFGNLKVRGILSLAPPADLSEGGDAKARQAADRRVEACFPEWESRVAQGDWDFIKNVVENGKTGPVPAIYCNISAVDYSWKLPTDKEPRPPMAVIVGENDGLVYTGREEIFKRFLGKLIGPENVIILPPGRSHKSKADVNGGMVQTGHNIFDRYLDGADRAAMADFLGSEVGKENVQEAYTRIAYLMQKWSGVRLPKVATNGDDNVTPQGLLELFYRKYANFLSFREFVKSYVYHDFRRTDKIAQLLERRQAIENYKKAVELLVKKAEQRTEESFSMQKKSLSDKYKVRSVEGADRELNVDRSPQRREALRSFFEEAVKIRQNVIATSPDPKLVAAERVAKIYKPEGVFDLKDAEEQLRSGDFSKDKQRRKVLDAYVLNVKRTQNEAEKELGQKISTELELRVVFPLGIRTIADAEFELKVDGSEGRRAQIHQYLAEMNALNLAIDAAKIKSRAEASRELAPPLGIATYAEADAELARVVSIMEFKFAKEADPVTGINGTKNLVDIIVDAEKSILIQNSLIAENIIELRKAKDRRALRKAKLDSLLQSILDPSLASLQETRDRALKMFAEANHRYDVTASDSIAQAYDSGQLNPAEVKRLFTALRPLAEQYMRARQLFLKSNKELASAKLSAAIAGQFGPEIQSLAQDIFGVDGRGGLEKHVRDLIEARDKSFSIKATLEFDLFKVKKKYNELVPGFYQLSEVPVAKLLDLSYVELVSKLNEPYQGRIYLDALRGALKEFSDMWDNRDMPEKKGADIN